VSLVADGPVGSLPDIRGMSARDAMLRLAKLGLPVRMIGDGFVVAQDPPAGSPIDVVDVCVLTLERSPARLLATSSP
jgi:beta-lactam-binding protein with PASTA domain